MCGLGLGSSSKSGVGAEELGLSFFVLVCLFFVVVIYFGGFCGAVRGGGFGESPSIQTGSEFWIRSDSPRFRFLVYGDQRRGLKRACSAGIIIFHNYNLCLFVCLFLSV